MRKNLDPRDYEGSVVDFTHSILKQAMAFAKEIDVSIDDVFVDFDLDYDWSFYDSPPGIKMEFYVKKQKKG